MEIQKKAHAFIESMDSKFRMINRDDLLKLVQNQEQIQIIDLRSAKAFELEHLQNSINIELHDLPIKYTDLDKDKMTVAVCNGSVQSAYAIFFLYLNGFTNVFNLSGGISGCVAHHFPLLVQSIR